MDCRKCGGAIPAQIGPGRRRSMCESCSPPDRRDRAERRAAVLPMRQQETGSLVDAARAALTGAGRLESAEGALLLLLAARLDGGGHNAAGMAALAGRYLAALDAALKGSRGASSALDELRERRARRRGA